jgi:hypothetical protein
MRRDMLDEIAASVIGIVLVWFLVALIVVGAFAFLAPPPARAAEPRLGQETFEYCIYRGRLAMEIARHVKAGKQLAQIEIAFKQAADTVSEQEDRDLWVSRLKEEITAAMQVVPMTDPQFKEKVGQKIAETCAYNYGKSRTEKGAAAVNDFVQVASSGTIALDSQACADLRYDVEFIAQMKEDAGATANDLVGLAHRSPELSDERLERILKLIASAYAYPGSMLDWKAENLKGCK